MKHTYKKYFGMFDYADLYKEVIDRTDTSATFVEIGSFHGKSAAYMGCEIINSGKNIHLYCVDPWDFKSLDLRESHPLAKFMINKLTGQHAFDTFKKAIEPYKSNVSYMKMKSVEASKHFNNSSIDFVFIDGDHSYLGCYMDIACWYKKVKPGGLIAGHDYLDSTMPGVTRAVRDLLPHAVTTSKKCWMYRR